MADKRIQDLVEASSVQLADLFVLEQAGTAKKLTGQTLVNDLAAALDGHGGIEDITYSPPVSPSLSGTLTITMADESTYTLSVTNGRGITGVGASKSGLTNTVELEFNDGSTDSFDVEDGRGISGLTWTESGVAGNGRVHTGTFEYSDGTESTVQIQDGLKGDQGDQTYVWFKWAQEYPTQDSDLQNNAGPFIGVYAGPAATAPTDYTAYVWFEYKGATGDTGASVSGIVLVGQNGLVDTYEIQLTDGSTGGTFTVTNALSIVRIDPPDNPGLPGVTDIYTIVFNDGSTSFFVVYNGTNGTGSVSTVSGLQPNNGDVPQVVILTTAPTTATPGQENQLAWDALNKQLYYCAGEVSGSYVWYGVSGNITVDASLSNSSTNPVQNKVITGKVGTSALNTTAQDLSGAVNELLAGIPSPSTSTPQKDGTGAVGTGTTWARSNHVHPLNVPASGTPSDLGTPSNGSASSYARSDHVHRKPALAELANDVPYMSMGLGEEIPENADLNSYTTPGVYRCRASSIAATLSNSPVSNAPFRLEVRALNIDNRLIQTVYTNDLAAVFYQRIFTGNWTTAIWTLVGIPTGGNTNYVLAKNSSTNKDVSFKSLGDVLSGLTYTTSGLSGSFTVVSGGYCKIGSIVIVAMRINTTAAISTGTQLMSGLPKPITSTSAATYIVPVTNTGGGFLAMNGNGEIRNPTSSGGGVNIASGAVIVLSCVYLTSE